MAPTSRETAAAHALANALLEFLSARDEARSRHQPPPAAAMVETKCTPSQSKEPKRLLLTGLEAAAMLGVSHGTLLNWRVPNGPIPYVKIGSVVRYAVDDLQEAIKQKRIRRKDSSDDDRTVDG